MQPYALILNRTSLDFLLTIRNTPFSVLALSALGRLGINTTSAAGQPIAIAGINRRFCSERCDFRIMISGLLYLFWDRPFGAWSLVESLEGIMARV